jgi:hypothetical protein
MMSRRTWRWVVVIALLQPLLASPLDQVYQACNQSTHHCVGLSNHSDCVQQRDCDVLTQLQLLPVRSSTDQSNSSSRTAKYCFYYRSMANESKTNGHAHVSVRLGSNSTAPQLELNCVFFEQTKLDHFQVAYLRNETGVWRIRLEPGVQPLHVSRGNWSTESDDKSSATASPQNASIKYCCFEQSMQLNIQYDQRQWPITLNPRDLHATFFYRNTAKKLKLQDTAHISLRDELKAVEHHSTQIPKQHLQHHSKPANLSAANNSSKSIEPLTSNQSNWDYRKTWALVFVSFVLLCFLLVIAITLYNLFIK